MTRTQPFLHSNTPTNATIGHPFPPTGPSPIQTQQPSQIPATSETNTSHSLATTHLRFNPGGVRFLKTCTNNCVSGNTALRRVASLPDLVANLNISNNDISRAGWREEQFFSVKHIFHSRNIKCCPSRKNAIAVAEAIGVFVEESLKGLPEIDCIPAIDRCESLVVPTNNPRPTASTTSGTGNNTEAQARPGGNGSASAGDGSTPGTLDGNSTSGTAAADLGRGSAGLRSPGSIVAIGAAVLVCLVCAFVLAVAVVLKRRSQASAAAGADKKPVAAPSPASGSHSSSPSGSPPASPSPGRLRASPPPAPIKLQELEKQKAMMLLAKAYDPAADIAVSLAAAAAAAPAPETTPTVVAAPRSIPASHPTPATSPAVLGSLDLSPVPETDEPLDHTPPSPLGAAAADDPDGLTRAKTVTWSYPIVAMAVSPAPSFSSEWSSEASSSGGASGGWIATGSEDSTGAIPPRPGYRAGAGAGAWVDGDSTSSATSYPPTATSPSGSEETPSAAPAWRPDARSRFALVVPRGVGSGSTGTASPPGSLQRGATGRGAWVDGGSSNASEGAEFSYAAPPGAGAGAWVDGASSDVSAEARFEAGGSGAWVDSASSNVSEGAVFVAK
ncbi:hypothetical protein HDU96_000131 [Phlyctochytrium bullatum]|nr:hypothetical protein HDU96_000131 [Phlyctochytrium bullatum]